MPADDRIFGPTGYSAAWLVLGIAAVVGGVALAVAALRPWWARPPEPAPTLLAAAKARHLAALDALVADVAAARVGPRAAHHRLSRTMRHFAADLGAAGAPAMSAAALRTAGFVGVAVTIAGNEEPQFHPTPDADPLAALAAARVIIESWGDPA